MFENLSDSKMIFTGIIFESGKNNYIRKKLLSLVNLLQSLILRWSNYTDITWGILVPLGLVKVRSGNNLAPIPTFSLCFRIRIYCLI